MRRHKDEEYTPSKPEIGLRQRVSVAFHLLLGNPLHPPLQRHERRTGKRGILQFPRANHSRLHPVQWEALLGRSGVSNETEVVLYGDNNNWFAAFAYWLFKLYGYGPARLLSLTRRSNRQSPTRRSPYDVR